MWVVLDVASGMVAAHQDLAMEGEGSICSHYDPRKFFLCKNVLLSAYRRFHIVVSSHDDGGHERYASSYGSSSPPAWNEHDNFE